MSGVLESWEWAASICSITMVKYRSFVNRSCQKRGYFLLSAQLGQQTPPLQLESRIHQQRIWQQLTWPPFKSSLEAPSIDTIPLKLIPSSPSRILYKQCSAKALAITVKDDQHRQWLVDCRRSQKATGLRYCDPDTVVVVFVTHNSYPPPPTTSSKQQQ